MKNLIKDRAAQLINWQAKDNNDTSSTAQDISRMYATGFSLLFVAATISAFFGAYFDYKVLQNLGANQPLLFAIGIHLIIFATGGPLMKALANQLHQEKLHRVIMLILAPILLLAISTSIVISLNTSAAERTNLEKYANTKINEIEKQREKADAATATAISKISKASQSDKIEQKQLFQEEKKQMQARHYLEIIRLKKKAKKYKNIQKDWAQVTANLIKSDSIPNTQKKHAIELEELQKKYNQQIAAIDQGAQKAKEITRLTDEKYKSDLSALNNLTISTAKEDFSQIATFKKWRNILFSLLALVVLFGIYKFYSIVNKARGQSNTANTVSEEIKKLKDKIRNYNSRIYSSITKRAKQRNFKAATAAANELEKKYKIQTKFQGKKTSFHEI